MNHWVVAFGDTLISEKDLESIATAFTAQKSNQSKTLFQYRGSALHYVSLVDDRDGSDFSYHYETPSTLLGFSGLITDTHMSDRDYRKCEQLTEFANHLPDVIDHTDGSFAFFKITPNSFECVSDPLGTHKLFYYRDPSGSYFLSNHPALIRVFSGKMFNPVFYVQFIAAGGIYGNITDHPSVFTTPEFSLIKWSKDEGFLIHFYRPLTYLIKPENKYRDLIDETIQRLKRSASYLDRYHQPVVSLSGGYDSRVALNMFCSTSKRSLLSYTFPDASIDSTIARNASKDLGIPHTFLKSFDLPEFEELDSYLMYRHAPFFDYHHVFNFLFEKQIHSFFRSSQSVWLTGLGGATHFGVSGHKNVLNLRNEEAILALISNLIKPHYLTGEAAEFLKSDMQKYYFRKYLPLIDQTTAGHQLATIHFFLERFGIYQSLKNYLNTLDRNFYLPFANLSFLRTVFASPEEHLYRHQKNSIHHELCRGLCNGEGASIPFSMHAHWDASTSERVRFRIERYLKNQVGVRIKPDRKYSDQVRLQFFENHLPYYREVIQSNNSSELWDYFDRKTLLSLFDSRDQLFKYHSSYISKIVPLLRMGT